MSHMIELRKVSKFYTNKDLVSTGFSKLDLNLDMGEFVAITGESGSGKSTLLNVISGLDSYEEGELFVAGEDTSAFRTEDYEQYRKTYIGNIFQDFNLVNSYTVYQNIELSMLLCGADKSVQREKIYECLRLVGMENYAKTKASKLSGGQKQRVAIARALAKNAPIIVADEPTGNLDSASAEKVMEILHRISADKLVVIVTHNYEQAEPYVTRKITMHDGRIIEDKKLRNKSAEELEAEPQIRYEDYNDAQYSDASSTYTENDKADSDAQGETPRLGSRSARNAEREKNEKFHRKSRSVRNTQNEGAEIEKKSAGSRGGRTARRSSDGGYGNISMGAQLRLGVRNAFNIPAKFILLLIVYTFVSAAVMNQYASTLKSWHSQSLLGSNEYFTDTSAERIIVTKKDKSAFTTADYDKIQKMNNVDYIIKCDSGIDSGISFESSKYVISGPMYPASTLKKSELSMGRLPKKDTEVVLEVDQDSYSYDAIKSLGEKILGKKYYIQSLNGSSDDHLLKDKVSIVGVIFLDEKSNRQSNGNTYIYVTDSVAAKILVKSTATSANVTMDFAGTKQDFSGYQVVYPSAKVPKGQVYISEDQAYQYFENGSARGKSFTLSVKTHYFKDTKNLKIGQVFKESNIESTLGLAKKNYDSYSGNVYISKSDYNDLFNKGNYQSSVYVKNEKNSDRTVQALHEAGFKTLVVKDTLSSDSDSFTFFLKLGSAILMGLEFVVLFFIAYAVIRLVMRSRNSYYSTLRILGATKKNTDNILRTELLLMMGISYGVVVVCAALIKRGIIPLASMSAQLSYFGLVHYVLLLIVLLLMSLLIANRYSRKIFSKSAMKSYRGEEV
jgi:putative ABC transport system permease protein